MFDSVKTLFTAQVSLCRRHVINAVLLVFASVLLHNAEHNMNINIVVKCPQKVTQSHYLFN